MSDLNRIKDAMFANSMPCNPKPFAHALDENFDSASIKTDEAKQVLWVLMAQAYGELATIDLYKEYQRLSNARENSSTVSSCCKVICDLLAAMGPQLLEDLQREVLEQATGISPGMEGEYTAIAINKLIENHSIEELEPGEFDLFDYDQSEDS